MMTLRELLEQHKNDYVCVDVNCAFRTIALGNKHLKDMESIWLDSEVVTLDETGADYYDIYVLI